MIVNNKRGILLASEMVKIVISVIAIAFLVYFLSMLYFSKVAEQKQVEAESVMISSEDSIKNIIKIIKENPEVTEKGRALGVPKGWYLFSFTDNEDGRPNSCAGKNCLCICDNVLDYFDRQLKYCDDTGVCLIVENLSPDLDLELEIEAEGEDLTEILIKYDGSSNVFIVEEK